MGVKRALLREVAIKWGLTLLTLGLFAIVDVLWPLWDEQNRALHDLLARTRVIRG
jgi:hypothetical protein